MPGGRLGSVTVRKTLIVLASATGLLLAACGSGSNATTGAATPSAAAASQGATAAAGLPACTAADLKVSGGFGAKPTVTIPDTCSPPTTLVVKDLVEGAGAAVKEGDTVDTDYLLVTWSDKQVLDTSFGRQPFPVENVGHAQVIDGWNQGMIGIKQGGRRLLIVPPDLGYGPGGNGVQPNETLVFVVDAVKVS